MNDGIADVINSIGALSEMWMVIYASFLKQGMDETHALSHTKALMETIISSEFGGNKGGN